MECVDQKRIWQGCSSSTRILKYFHSDDDYEVPATGEIKILGLLSAVQKYC